MAVAVAQTVAVADAVRVVVQGAVVAVLARGTPTVAHAAIREAMDGLMDEATDAAVSAPTPAPMDLLMPTSHPAMMPILSHATTHNPPTMRHATSAHVPRKSATARVAAAVTVVAAVAAAWVGNAVKRHARPPRVASLTRCAPA